MSTIPSTTFLPTPDLPPLRLPLEHGDHLTRDEFERRYDATPDLKKAELIEGVVYMPPVSDGYHSEPQFNFVTFLGVYRWATPGVRGGDNASLKLDMKNMPQPDAYLAIEPSFGGRVRHDDNGLIIGAPEWVGEVSASSASYDLHEKKECYRRNGVQEYVVWRVKEKAIDWFLLRGENFEPLAAVAGIFKSECFPGLWLAADALIAQDFAQVRKVLEQGLAAPEHAAFLERLAKNKSS